jgi:thioredoxin reductase (NADPH)
MEDLFDFGIVGGGPAGLAAAMYAGRLGLTTIIFADNFGGTITLTDVVENYPGFRSISGADLGDALLEHAEDYDVEFVEELVTEVKSEGDCFAIKTKDGEYGARTVLFATGMKHRKLDAPGVQKYENRGVYYCALCDGPLFKGKTVAVIGGSDSAVKEALLLTQYAEKVYIIYRGENIRPEPVNAKRIEGNEKIKVITNTKVTEIKGDETVTGVVLDRPYNGQKELPLDAVFMAIGGTPQSDLAVALGVETNEKGEIKIDRSSRTNIKGIYAAGDVADGVFKQAITGAAEGVIAAHSAYEDITEGSVCPTGEG